MCVCACVSYSLLGPLLPVARLGNLHWIPHHHAVPTSVETKRSSMGWSTMLQLGLDLPWFYREMQIEATWPVHRKG